MTNQAPSATDWKQMYEEERKIVSDIWDALGIKTYADAKGKSIVEIVSELKAPSATVDEPKHLSTEQRQAIFNFFHDKEVVLMDDDLNTIEGIVYPRTYPYTLKDEQATVDVDEIVMKYLSQWEESVGWFDSCEEPPYFKQLITGAITEALRGSYTREDMRKYAIGFLDSIRDYERENGQRICFDERESSELLDQYDTERGKSNG